MTAGVLDDIGERRLDRSVRRLELWPLFADSSLPSYDAAAAMLLTQRVLDFLAAR